MRKKSLGFYLVVLVLGAVIGTVLGDVLGLILPEGVVKQFFLKSASFSVGPAALDLRVISLTLGFALHINITGVLGIIIVAYFLRWLD
jgi:uncharacterized membrane-anchored protein